MTYREMALTIPMIVGGIAAYVQKKTEKPYFFEQVVGGVAGYGIGIMRVFAQTHKPVVYQHPIAAITVPAVFSGIGWGIGRATGGMLGEASR